MGAAAPEFADVEFGMAIFEWSIPAIPVSDAVGAATSPSAVARALSVFCCPCGEQAASSSPDRATRYLCVMIMPREAVGQ